MSRYSRRDLVDDDDAIDQDDSSPNGETDAPSNRQRRSNRQRQRRKRSESESDDDEEATESRTSTQLLARGEKVIKIGDAHQVAVEEEPTCGEEERDEEPDRDWLVWTPSEDLDEGRLVAYCEDAECRFKIPSDRALFVLMKSNYDFDKALRELARRRIISEIWTTDEANLFRNAFFMYGKNFARIRTLLPYRSTASIVQHYYTTKKEFSYKSSFDAKLAEEVDNDESEDELRYISGSCQNCFEKTNRLQMNTSTNRHECNTCVMYLRLMRTPRRTMTARTIEDVRRTNPQICDSMKDIAAQFAMMSSYVEDVDATAKVDAESNDDDEKSENSAKDEGDESAPKKSASVKVVKRRDTVCIQAIQEYNQQVHQQHLQVARYEKAFRRQRVELMKANVRALKDRMQRLVRIDDEMSGVTRSGRPRHVPMWSDKERRDAVYCFLRYGEDFEAVSEVLGTKSVDMVRHFYSEIKPVFEKTLKDNEENIKAEAAKLSLADVIYRKEEVEVIDLD